MSPEFKAEIDLLDGIKPPTHWCQVRVVNELLPAFSESWSVFPTHVSGNSYTVLFLCEEAPIQDFFGKKLELKRGPKILGWITVLQP